MALAGMFYVGGEYPSAQEHRGLLEVLEGWCEGAKQEEIAQCRRLGMVMLPAGDDVMALLWVVLIRGVGMEGYKSVSAAMDCMVLVMRGNPDGRVKKWDMHGEWVRLTLFLGESPDRAMIREANEVGFERAMVEDGEYVRAVPDAEVGRLTDDEQHLRRAFWAYCVYGFESQYWE